MPSVDFTSEVPPNNLPTTVQAIVVDAVSLRAPSNGSAKKSVSRDPPALCLEQWLSEIGSPGDAVVDAVRRVRRHGRPERWCDAVNDARYEWVVSPALQRDHAADHVLVQRFNINSVAADSEVATLRRRLQIEHAVTRALAHSDSFDDATGHLMEAVREPLGAAVAECWVRDGDTLHMQAARHDDDAALRKFVARKKPVSLKLGAGLPGYVWKTKTPEWIESLDDDHRFVRAQFATAVGLISAAAFPVLAHGRVLGVIQLFFRRPTPRQTEWLDMMAAIGSQVGQFIQRFDAERALSQSEKRFRQVVHALPAAVYTLNGDGFVALFNDAAVELWGRSPKFGKDKWSGSLKMYQPDMTPLPLDQCPMALAFRSGEPIRGREVIVERPDGSRRTALAHPEPILDAAGCVIGGVNMLVDVTDYRRTEQNLRASEEQLRFTLDAARVGTWDWRVGDDTLRYSENMQSLHALPPASPDVAMQTMLATVDEADRRKVRRAIDLALRRGDEFRAEYRVNIDDTPRWIEAKGRVFRDASGQAVRLSGVCQDVTDRQNAEQWLETLAAVGGVLAGSLDFEQAMSDVADLAVPRLADWCVIDVVNEQGELSELTVRHNDPAKLELARELRRRFPPAPDAPHGAVNVVRTGKPEVYTHITDELLNETAQSPEHFKVLRELGLRSALVVPLIARGRTLGALTLVSDRSQITYREADLPMFQEFARGCAMAIDAARLYTAATREIERRVKTEAALRRSERIYRAIGESIDYGIWITDPRGRNVYASESFLKLVGMTQQQCSNFGWGDVLHPDDVERTMTAWKQCVSEGKTWSIEHRFRGVDGKYHPVLARGVPVRNDKNEIICWAGINLDISELKQAERRARRQAGMLERTLDVNTSLAGQLDQQTLLQAVTDAATEMSGAQFGAFFYNAREQGGDEYMLYTLSGVSRERFADFPMPRATELFGPTFRGEGVIRLDDVKQDARYGRNAPHHGMPAEHLPVRSYMAAPVVSRNGEVLGGLFFGHSEPGVFGEEAEKVVLGVAAQAAVALDNARLYESLQRELAERRRAEQAMRQMNEQLRERNEEMTQFIYTVSHDLKSPLVTAMGFVGIMREDLAENHHDALEESLTHVDRAVRQMDELINDLSQLGRVGRLKLQREPIDVAALARQLAGEFKPRFDDAGATLVVADGLPTINADRQRLTQVLDNLLSNALKYGGASGLRVEVGGRQEFDQALLYVADNGPGIASAYHEKIFGLFERLDSRSEGTGVGLAIVARIMQLHGGKAWVASHPGQGATFWLSFPADAPDGETGQEEQHE